MKPLSPVAEITDGVAAAMRKARWDNMGLDIVVYWPELEWPADRTETRRDR